LLCTKGTNYIILLISKHPTAKQRQTGVMTIVYR